MRAILIDSFTGEIREVDHNGNYRQIYEYIGNGCQGFEAPVGLPNGDVLYVDEEGLYHPPLVWFQWKGHPQPFAGRGLFLGSNRVGDTVALKSSMDDIRSMVEFGELVRVPAYGIVWIGIEEVITAQNKGEKE